MSSKRIGIDVDGVLANFFPAYEKLWIEESGGIDLFPKNVLPPVWNWPEHYGYDPALTSKVWARIKESHYFWEELMPFAGTNKFLDTLARSGHEAYFITDRPGMDSQLQTQFWLNDHGYSFPNVIISRKGKGIVCNALSIEFYIDDKPENVVDVLKYGPECFVFCLDYPYNRNHAGLEEYEGHYSRISSLEEFLHGIER